MAPGIREVTVGKETGNFNLKYIVTYYDKLVKEKNAGSYEKKLIENPKTWRPRKICLWEFMEVEI